MDEETRDPRFFEALGRAIKMHRARLGLERKNLADLAAVSYLYLAEIENGKKRASSRALLSLSQALGMRASELLEEAERINSADQELDSLPQNIADSGRVDMRTAMTAAASAARRRPRFTGTTRAGAGRQAIAASTVQTHLERILEKLEPTKSPGSAQLLELIRIAADLSEDDVQRLIDLANRLSD